MSDSKLFVVKGWKRYLILDKLRKDCEVCVVREVNLLEFCPDCDIANNNTKKVRVFVEVKE